MIFATAMRPTLTLAIASLLLSACGGGGGGSSATVTPPAQTGLQITSSNMEAAAATGYLAANSSANLGNTGASVTGSATTLPASVSQGAVQVQSAGINGDGTARPAGSLNGPYACAQGGTFQIYLNDNDHSLTLSVGDDMLLNYASCGLLNGTAMNGVLDATLTALSGSLHNSTGALGFTLQLTAFGAADSGGGFSTSGTLAFTATQNATGVHIVGTTPSLTIQGSTAQNVATHALKLENATIDANVSNSALSTTITETVTESGGTINGTYSITTVTPVTYSLATAGATPTGGKLKIVAAKGTLWVTFLGNGTVQLDLDEASNGTITVTKTKNLSDLRAL